MVSWSARRQFLYIGGTLTVFLFAIALPTFFVTYDAPSCIDGIKNQDETGVDCGGSCSVICKASALDMIVHWQRVFKVKEGIYNAVAYVENPNLNSGIKKIPYRFKLYDADNLLLYERKGETFVPPKKIFGIFESNITIGSRVPVRTLFEFLSVPTWKKDFSREPALLISDKVFSIQDGLPRLTASIVNPTDKPVYNVEVVAILYDALDNAVAASRTTVDSIEKDAVVPLVFTWPEAFSKEIVRSELPFRVLD